MKKTLGALSLVFLAGCNMTDAWRSADQPPVKPKAAAKVELSDLTKQTQAWLDQNEPRLKAALEGSGFALQRERNVLVVTMPVKGSFNPDRPQMLLPAKLGPLTRLAKITEADKSAAVLVLGHADSSGAADKNRELSLQRAAAVASIFRLSGLQRDRMLLKGVGSDMPRAANDSPGGRELNRRVDIILTPKNTLAAIVDKYSSPPKPTLAADQTSKAKAN